MCQHVVRLAADGDGNRVWQKHRLVSDLVTVLDGSHERTVPQERVTDWGGVLVAIAAAGVLVALIGAAVPVYVYLAAATLAAAVWKTDHSAPNPVSRPDVTVRHPCRPGAGPASSGGGSVMGLKLRSTATGGGER